MSAAQTNGGLIEAAGYANRTRVVGELDDITLLAGQGPRRFE